MTDAQLVRLKQVALFLGILMALTLVIHVFLSWTVGKDKKDPAKKSVIHSIPSVTRNVDDSGVWMQRMESKLITSEKRNNELEKQIQSQSSQMEELVKSQQQILLELTQKIEEMSLHATASVNIPSSGLPEQGAAQYVQSNNAWPPQESAYGENQSGMMANPAIFTTSLKLVDKNKNLKSNYLPAGTFARAVILGGVDASASITSQGEPRPVLLRLVDIGVLPNYSRANIQDCHIVAAAHGDISSERAYIRTERMSCTLNNGRVFESTLEGYIAGEDGKDGVRGKVVRREGDLLWNSFFAGAIAGLGNGMSQSLGTTSISPLGATTTTTGADILKSGAYSGVGEGADRLQKYFIERAEQYQPVIQVAAGREVTVVFTKGLSLDGLKL
ncbi:TrbI/VirB10 family protein [Candidatus Berkiella aquae]|uniref:Bacterial conjugation TrbI-like protein n=1 Tax=Candidatus Berkiella aquae TaxID=295108 RepID=A0A0Q9YS35_9GAMM|nr:TraB/VirB10 family protein [Candidatus Berkiella aquae]MCS5712826.1 TraB/VirB10 family protein [Candidatus Berkiella aquae]